MRLINRVHPAPLESLASLLERLRWANHYQEPQWLANLLPHLPSRLNLLQEPLHVGLLSELTDLSPAALVDMTLHRFTSWYYGRPSAHGGQPRRESSGLALWPGWRSAEYAQHGDITTVCPQCWQEQRVILLPWALFHITACRRHQVLLVRGCPWCGACLRLDVTRTRCGRCGALISAFPPHSIAAHPESLILTDLLYSATGCTAGFPPPTLSLAADHPLRRVGTATLLRCLWDCAQDLAGANTPLPLLSCDFLLPGTTWAARPQRLAEMTIPARHNALLAAWNLLSTWSESWLRWLQRPHAAHTSRSGDGPPFPIALRYHPDGKPVWTLARRWWLTFLGERSTEGYPWGQADLPAYPAVDAYAWNTRWNGQDLRLTIEEAAPYCQLQTTDLDALVEAGLLHATFGSFPHSPDKWFFSERRLHQGLRMLLAPLPVQTSTEGDGPPATDLVWTLDQGRSQGVGLVHILRALHEGRLAGFRTRPTVQLCDLRFPQEAVHAFLEQETRCGRAIPPREALPLWWTDAVWSP